MNSEERFLRVRFQLSGRSEGTSLRFRAAGGLEYAPVFDALSESGQVPALEWAPRQERFRGVGQNENSFENLLAHMALDCDGHSLPRGGQCSGGAGTG